jgi:hypothetical protein
MTAEPVRKRTTRIQFTTLEDGININASDPQLEVQFSIVQRLTPDPNAGRIQIMNLGPSSRGWIQSNVRRSVNVANTTITPNGSTAKPGTRSNSKAETHARADVYVEIEAGYDDRTGIIFEGSTQKTRDTHTPGAQWVTDVIVGDALASQMGAIVSRQFTKGARVLDALRHLVGVMGLGLGNLSAASLTAAIGTGSKTFPLGLTMQGNAKWFVDKILSLTGAEWFVDAGEFFIVRRSAALEEPEIFLSPDTGLIGRPQPTEDDGVTIGMQIRTDVRIGRRVRVESNSVRGVYRVDELRHTGNNRRGQFMSTAILRSINPLPAIGGV